MQHLFIHTILPSPLPRSISLPPVLTEDSAFKTFSTWFVEAGTNGRTT